MKIICPCVLHWLVCYTPICTYFKAYYIFLIWILSLSSYYGSLDAFQTKHIVLLISIQWTYKDIHTNTKGNADVCALLRFKWSFLLLEAFQRIVILIWFLRCIKSQKNTCTSPPLSSSTNVWNFSELTWIPVCSNADCVFCWNCLLLLAIYICIVYWKSEWPNIRWGHI